MTALPPADDPAADPELVPLLARAAAGVPHVLDLTYLPQVDLASGQVVGVDVKLRVAHPRRGLLAPALFWPAAQTAGLLSGLAYQAVRRCVQEVQPSDRRRGTALRVWVPLPGVLVREPGLLALLEELAGELAPRALVLQFGEGGLDTVPDLAFRLAALRGAGAAVAVRTGDTSRSRECLDAIQGADALRLSPRLVGTVAPLGRDGARGDVEASLAELIESAHRRDLVVAATAVDSWDASAVLCELGCDRASGYLFSPPLPATWVNGLLRGDASWLDGRRRCGLDDRTWPVPPQ